MLYSIREAAVCWREEARAAHLQEPWQHLMGQDDWLHPLLLLLQLIAVLPRKHVDLPLVHAQLTDVCLRTAAELTSPAPLPRLGLGS